jgi:uncharacterized protein YgiM (DUF1202 family)
MNDKDQCNTGDWSDIVAVFTNFHTVGLKADSTVVAVGDTGHGQCNTGDWRDIVAVSTGDYHTVGLKTDGTVVAVGDYCQCDTGNWRDIVAVSAGTYDTVGLKADGTVVAVGKNDKGQCNTGAWRDIVAVSAGNSLTVGLKADGTVVAVGNNDKGQCNTGAWRDIVAVFAGSSLTVGLKANGTVVAVGLKAQSQCNTDSWQNIGPVDKEKLKEQMKKEREHHEWLATEEGQRWQAEEKRKAEEKRAAEERRKEEERLKKEEERREHEKRERFEIIKRKTINTVVLVVGLAVIGGVIVMAAGSIRNNQPGTAAMLPTELIIPAMPTATVISEALNFRSGPGTNSTIIKTLKKGDTLSVTGETQNGWLPVEHNDDKGYVSSEMVTINNEINADGFGDHFE